MSYNIDNIEIAKNKGDLGLIEIYYMKYGNSLKCSNIAEQTFYLNNKKITQSEVQYHFFHKMQYIIENEILEELRIVYALILYIANFESEEKLEEIQKYITKIKNSIRYFENVEALKSIKNASYFMDMIAVRFYDSAYELHIINKRYNMIHDEKVPEELLCPISYTIMNEPVIDRYGDTYEKSAIVEWLKKNKSSPLNRRPIEKEDLIPNRIVMDMVQNIND